MIIQCFYIYFPCFPFFQCVLRSFHCRDLHPNTWVGVKWSSSPWRLSSHLAGVWRPSTTVTSAAHSIRHSIVLLIKYSWIFDTLFFSIAVTEQNVTCVTRAYIPGCFHIHFIALGATTSYSRYRDIIYTPYRLWCYLRLLGPSAAFKLSYFLWYRIVRFVSPAVPSVSVPAARLHTFNRIDRAAEVVTVLRECSSSSRTFISYV